MKPWVSSPSLSLEFTHSLRPLLWPIQRNDHQDRQLQPHPRDDIWTTFHRAPLSYSNHTSPSARPSQETKRHNGRDQHLAFHLYRDGLEGPACSLSFCEELVQLYKQRPWRKERGGFDMQSFEVWARHFDLRIPTETPDDAHEL